MRIGGSGPRQVDVRIVAASNVDLRAEVKAGRFREDLFYRLNVFPIELPPLRERRDDLPLLMEHCMALYSKGHRRQFTGFTRRAVEALLNYDYPGNIRELQNLIERGVIYADEGGATDSVHMFRRGELLRSDVFALGSEGGLQQRGGKGAAPAAGQSEEPSAAALASDPPASLALIARAIESGARFKELESHAYAAALAKTEGNVSAAARLLGVTRAQLDYRLAKLRSAATRTG